MFLIIKIVKIPLKMLYYLNFSEFIAFRDLYLFLLSYKFLMILYYLLRTYNIDTNYYEKRFTISFIESAFSLFLLTITVIDFVVSSVSLAFSNTTSQVIPCSVGTSDTFKI